VVATLAGSPVAATPLSVEIRPHVATGNAALKLELHDLVRGTLDGRSTGSSTASRAPHRFDSPPATRRSKPNHRRADTARHPRATPSLLCPPPQLPPLFTSIVCPPPKGRDDSVALSAAPTMFSPVSGLPPMAYASDKPLSDAPGFNCVGYGFKIDTLMRHYLDST